MDCKENLLKALQDCGEPAAFYRGQEIQLANDLFADILETDTETCKGMPINEICHVKSIEMIQDFIRRREMGEDSVPNTYSAAFRTLKKNNVELKVTVLKTKHTDGAFLVLIERK
ncbi:MAG: hypothetical protein JXB45_00140 [Candidatus Krumholzibacteriota bacterium]|nr:hypothetical protein [Candidatus Krumholzibacteriota bacterium]